MGETHSHAEVLELLKADPRLNNALALIRDLIPAMRIAVRDTKRQPIAGFEGDVPSDAIRQDVTVGLVAVGAVAVWSEGADVLEGQLRAAAKLAAAHTSSMVQVYSDPAQLMGGDAVRVALETSRDAIWDWDLLSNTTYYSPRWFDMLGYKAGEFEASFATWAQMTVQEDVKATVAMVQAAVAAGRSYEAVFRMRHANGSLRWIRGRGRVTARGPDGTPVRYSGTNSDITESVLAEKERERLEAALRQSERLSAIGQLAGGIAHDFNNHLTVIIGASEALVDEVEDPELRAFAQDILSSSEHAGALTRKLLGFARHTHLQTEPVDVGEMLSDAVSVLRRSLDPSIEVAYSVAAEAPVVMGDRSALQNAVLNLALNARDAMPEGGRLTLEVREAVATPVLEAAAGVNAAAQFLSIEVTDTGTGIAPEHVPRLFEPFFTTKAQGEGTGLGLASVHGTALSHGGAVDVDSEPGRGSCFRMLLPRPMKESGAAESAPEDADSKSAARRVLVIDDEPLVRNQVSRTLRRLGHHVESAGGGAEGLTLWDQSEGSFDVVFLDVMMPQMNGGEVLERLLARSPKALVVLISGYARSGEVQRLLDLGATAFLQKPFRKAALIEVLSETLTG